MRASRRANERVTDDEIRRAVKRSGVLTTQQIAQRVGMQERTALPRIKRCKGLIGERVGQRTEWRVKS